MTKPKHLPECFNGRQRSGGLPCICDRLRACEQRVNGHRLSYENGVEVGYDKGYVAGLDAAWIAVGNVPCATTTHGDDWRDIPGSTVKREALAAIRALKEKE